MDDALRRALAGHRTFDLTTIGRRSGRPRRVEIWYFVIDGELYVTGTPGRRDWVANATADPRVTIHVTAGAPQEAEGRAEVITDVGERRRLMTRIIELEPWYAEQGHTLDEWVDGAPLIRIDLAATD